jgi:hypothetical protein
MAAFKRLTRRQGCERFEGAGPFGGGLASQDSPKPSSFMLKKVSTVEVSDTTMMP